MDTITNWLLNLNLFEVALTAAFSAYISVRAQKQNFQQGIQVTEQAKNEITSELRGQIGSIRDNEKN